ncbi:MAG TPA: hypothetical protein VG318_05165 [Actinomycetota bacterium]|nr:hypothetical protein [Actinomycetota bacterium]
MLKKVLVSVVAAFLVAAPVGAGALAKGKKKAPKPYVSPEMTIQVGHPAFHDASGTLLTVTAQEFINTCAVPASNGVDAAVYEVPAEYKGIQATIKAIGSGSQVPHDVDIYLFNDACEEVGFYNATGTDELGILTADTAFVLLHNYTGDPVNVHYELTPPGK